jgi:hypothetical protein
MGHGENLRRVRDFGENRIGAGIKADDRGPNSAVRLLHGGASTGEHGNGGSAQLKTRYEPSEYNFIF